MGQGQKHRWVSGRMRDERAALYQGRVQGLAFHIESHQRLRGPYTAAGELLRQVVPMVMERWPEVVERHVVEILTMAPELRSVVPASRETLTSLAIPEERTRYYSRMRTMRLTNGVVDFLKKITVPERLGRLQVVFEHAGDCEVLDGEFLSTLLRRVHAEQMELTICTQGDAGQPLLQEALVRYAERVEAPVLAAKETCVNGQGEEILTLAERFVQSDGTSDRSEELTAYESLPERERQALHDRRADELTALGDTSWQYGAIPWHRERGSSALMAMEALRHALEYCINIGAYEATVDFGLRGRKWADWSDAHFAHMWAFTFKTTNALAALGRTEEAEAMSMDALASTDSVRVQTQVAYATAMLYTRHHANRDHETARQWIEKAISYAQTIEDEKMRAFRTVFYNNGLALIEMHVNRIEEALRLVTEGQQLLNRVLAPDEHLLHRSVLIHNKALILASMKRYEEALADFNRVIEIDPNYPEYHFDRGNLYNKMGRLEEAVENYTHAIEISPPFPEVYFNRAGAYSRLGMAEKALADYDYLLDIDPTHLDGRLNRATLFLEAGETALARQDAEEGLALDPTHAQLLCTLGLIEMAEGRLDAAQRALTAALEIDAGLLEAHVNLSVLLFECDDAQGAVDALNRAVQQHPEANVLYFNRAWALQSLGHWQEAVADYSKALELGCDEAEEIRARRETCLQALGTN
ncbi:tetratricopeptide repeat protein [Tumebacillus sp. DT12]|uniref:Tetratricopeptide repeat protein n=1 Tax=Tumebacillus lacus TaxID=2995335 RepID=A0ABT3X5B7_9BACL|nr:tetratricopeptide repeat protein [Tumebacillus lacus]MCX7570775.1 tetratricopeptide repeat protein [Tumebacillus lacus]